MLLRRLRALLDDDDAASSRRPKAKDPPADVGAGAASEGELVVVNAGAGAGEDLLVRLQRSAPSSVSFPSTIIAAFMLLLLLVAMMMRTSEPAFRWPRSLAMVSQSMCVARERSNVRTKKMTWTNRSTASLGLSERSPARDGKQCLIVLPSHGSTSCPTALTCLLPFIQAQGWDGLLLRLLLSLCSSSLFPLRTYPSSSVLSGEGNVQEDDLILYYLEGLYALDIDRTFCPPFCAGRIRYDSPPLRTIEVPTQYRARIRQIQPELKPSRQSCRHRSRWTAS
jgi:hypothetical protein